LITRMGDSFVDMMAPNFQVYAATCLWFAHLFFCWVSSFA
jgi:hypothetical protein